MRPHNSVGGYRIYPTSPQVAEFIDRGVATVAQFNEGMDRLNSERRLTQTQQNLVDNLDPNSPLARNYQGLITVSNRFWELALEKQQTLARNEFAGPYTVAQLGQHLNQCANGWHQFKGQLDEQA